MEILTLIIAIVVSLGIILSSLIKPSILIKNKNINLYWIIALLGAIILLISGSISFEETFKGLIKEDSINPIKILILFISMSMISIYLDELGFFSFVASKAIKICKNTQLSIFVILYVLVSILTMFTSNDIIILTLTPFIIEFCKRSKIDPIPYLVSEFVAANTWSMMFIVGNPTNIYLASSFNISFVDYFIKMAIPTLLAGIVEFGILLLLFYKKLKTPITKDDLSVSPLKDEFLTIFGLVVLGVTTVLLVISSYIKFEMYLISLFGFLTLFVLSSIYISLKDKSHFSIIFKSLKRGPYELIPFVISMFVIVLAFSKNGLSQNLTSFLASFDLQNLSFGYSSLLSANLINNIPMSVLFTDIIQNGLNSSEVIIKECSVYASIIGSNIGAFITPIGALAGIMFLNILKKNDVKYRFIDFMKYGIIIGIPAITVAILVL